MDSVVFEVTAEKTLWRDAGDLSMLDLEEGPIPSGEEAQMCALAETRPDLGSRSL